jgi:hypothetical protein
MCYLHITVRKVCRLINRRGVRVWGLSWPFLAHIEHISDIPTHSLTLFAWDCILVGDWVFLLHLHQLVIREALGGTPSKRHRLVTLGGFRLLDGLAVSVELSVKIVKGLRWWLWGVCAYLAGATKATLVEPRYLAIPYFFISKNKSCLDTGASENLKSTSTWIRGDRQITDTTGKIPVSLFLSS